MKTTIRLVAYCVTSSFLTSCRPNDDATRMVAPARSQHTREPRVGVSVSRPAALSEVGYLRLG